MHYPLACTKQDDFVMGTVTCFGQKKKSQEKMDETASSKYEKVSDKEVCFLRNKLAVALLRIRWWLLNGKYGLRNLVSTSDFHICNIPLFTSANWYFPVSVLILPDSVRPHRVALGTRSWEGRCQLPTSPPETHWHRVPEASWSRCVILSMCSSILCLNYELSTGAMKICTLHNAGA